MPPIEVITQADKNRKRGCIGCAGCLFFLFGIFVLILLMLVAIGANVPDARENSQNLQPVKIDHPESE